MDFQGTTDREGAVKAMASKKSFLRRLDERGYLLLAVRLFLGLYFIRTGYVKATAPFDFLISVRLYDLLPDSPAIFLNATAVVLPWLEMMCGAALVLGVWLRGAAVQIAAMLLVFMPTILHRALTMQAEHGLSFIDVRFDCGCGTGIEIIWIKLCKNTGLFLLALIVFLSRSRRFCLTLWLDRRKPQAIYCRQCGYRLGNSAEGLCEVCHESSVMPVVAPPPQGNASLLQG